MANKPGKANFFPDVPVYPEMGTFQPVYGKFDLTTYIQGASDYEIMAFLVGKYNATLEAYGTVTKLSSETIEAAHQLQDWINTWFDNLDVQQELNNKIDSMVADGSFGTLLHQTFDAQINQQTTNAVTAWLVANVTPTGSAVVVDKSLSIEGAAADAKVVGNTTLRTDINVYSSAQVVAPYDDLNTVPVNKVILYSFFDGVANYPSTSYGVCFTIAQTTTGKSPSNAIQIFADSNNILYMRTKISAWTSWTNIEKGVLNIYNASQAVAPFNDANTFPGNSHILCSYTGIKNLPTDNSIGLCVTHSLGTSAGAGSMQIFSDIDNTVSVRTKNNAGNWQTWTNIEKGVLNIYNASQAVAPFNDANTFPGNSHILCSYTGIKNLPTDNSIGLCVTHSLGTSAGAGSMQIFSDIDNTVSVRTKNNAGNWQTWTNINTTSDSTPQATLFASFTQFPKIGVIGDSYASGEIYINGNGEDYYELSWLQCIARTCGIKGTNFSSGGLSTRSWLTAPRGLSLVNSSDAQNLYIFALGINDYYALGESYLGSPDDIKDDYHDNPDTFYGNYAKIIEQVRAKAPNAKMLMLTTANTNETPMKFNNAIEYIANHYSIPFARQYEYEFFKSNYYKNMVGGHPTAMVYSGMAEAFKQIFSDMCVKYQSYFNNYVG